MQTWFTEELSLLKESAERFVERDYGFERRQAIAGGEQGFDPAVWAQMAELGWLAAPLPEAHDGLGGGALEVAVVMEAVGKGLIVEPYLATVVLGAGLVAAAGSEAQKRALLPAVASGELRLAFGYAEPQSRYDLADVATRAEAHGEGYRLNGHKSVVFHAAAADKLIVSARTAGESRDSEGISLFLLTPGAAGLDLRSYATVDGLRAAELRLENTPGELLGEAGGALPMIEQVIDQATVAVCAEAVGAMEVLLRSTQEYLKTREQFGVAIGAFQVLQHKVVDMFTACELSRALTYRAAAALAEASPEERARAASAAKVQVGKAARQVGQDAIQLHGGMGMTAEMAVGHYFKRASMIAQTFGDTDFHLRRFAG